MSGQPSSTERAAAMNDSTTAQESQDGSRKRPRDMNQNYLNGFHQGLMEHAWAGVSSQAWAGLRRKRSKVGGMFEPNADCAKENNGSNQTYSTENSIAMTGPIQLSRNAGRVFQHDQKPSSEGNSGRTTIGSVTSPTHETDAVTSSRTDPRSYHLSGFHGSRNEGALMPSQVTRNDPIASHQPSYQPPSRSIFDTICDNGLQDPSESSSSTVSRTSLQPLRNDPGIGTGAQQKGRNRRQEQQGTACYATGPVSLVNNARNASLASNTMMTLASSFYTPSVSEATGSCFTKLKSEVQNVSELISQQQTFCSSAEFEAFVSCSGLLGQPCFKRNPRLEKSTFAKFSKAWNVLAPDSNLSIVFHGTSKHNIAKILADGLDPKRRSGQAFGPGEYFSNNPGISVSYCNGGNEMLVFAVVEPRRRRPDCPPDYVVVANNSHQLPLGTVTFEGVEAQVMSNSSRMRKQLAYLSKIADRKAQEANDAMHKAEIIQLLIGKKVDIASEKYQNYLVDLSNTSKREIAMYVHRLVDKALFSYYFPELPEPMKTEERDVATIRSVEEAEREAKAAKDAFEKAKENASIPTGDSF